MTNSDVYSNTNVVVTVPAYGDIRIDEGTSGTGIVRMDDVTPNVREEAYGTGLGTGIQTVAGTAASSVFEFTPNMTPDGLTARIAYTPAAGRKNAADKASTTAHTAQGAGYDLTVVATDALHGMEGLTIHAGMSSIEQDSTTNYDGDEDQEVFAITYAMGSFTVGYTWSESDLGKSTGALQYDNEGYGITFNVNDDLSLGYNHYESDQDNDTDVTAEATSIQIAYTTGGASIRLADASVDNASYQTTAAYDKDATTLSVSLAF